MAHISDIKLIRTDTTLDLSQKAEKETLPLFPCNRCGKLPCPTLDPALLRPGRLDRKIEFPLPDRRQKRLVFQVCTSKMNLGDEVDLEDYVSRPDKISAAEVNKSHSHPSRMHAVRKNRYVILPKDFDKGYRANVKKPDTDFVFYKWSTIPKSDLPSKSFVTYSLNPETESNKISSPTETESEYSFLGITENPRTRGRNTVNARSVGSISTTISPNLLDKIFEADSLAFTVMLLEMPGNFRDEIVSMNIQQIETVRNVRAIGFFKIVVLLPFLLLFVIKSI
ncbi:hypothetical protein V2J09_014268 [Rumex salicifolius]